jgi:hypothetical protein
MFSLAAFLLAAAAPVQWHTAEVALPDGSVAEIQYVGDIPPRISVAMPVVQAEAAAQDGGGDGASGSIPRARRLVQARPDAPAAAGYTPPPPFIFAADTPAGSTYEYSLITTNVDGTVCTQRTEWTSRGKGKEPEVKRRDIGEGCRDAALTTRD